MKDGLNQGWKQAGRFLGVYSGYTVQAFKYIGPDGEVGWHTTSWPMRDPIHDFWVSGNTFYRMTIHLAEFKPHANRVEIFEELKNVDPAERSAVLEAIRTWEKPIKAPEQPATPSTRITDTKHQAQGIPYRITGGVPRLMELGDPTGADNVIDIDYLFVLTVNSSELTVPVHAKLVMGSNLFERLVEVFPPQLPPGINIRHDELQTAVRAFMFAFLNTEEALKEFRDSGVFNN